MRTVLAAFAIAAAVQTAHAAEIQAQPIQGFNNAYAIMVVGDIAYGDERTFDNVLAGIPRSSDTKVVVMLASPGGNVPSGLAIGRIIRKGHMDTAVMTGCASTCANIWLAGAIHFASVNAKIGFHAAFDARTPDVPDAPANAIVGNYLGEIGLGQEAIAILVSAAPTSILWLDQQLANQLGISVVWTDDQGNPLHGQVPERTPAPQPPTEPQVQTPQNQDWSAMGTWIQLASRDNLADAEEYAQWLKLTDAFVFESTSNPGWYVVAVGPFGRANGHPKAAFNYLMQRDRLPWDSRIVTGTHFGNLVWRQLAGSPINQF